MTDPVPDTTPTGRSAAGRNAFRAAFGGFLMGIANVIPGVSGGTMLLAAGIYPQFIDGVAEVTTFRFRPRTLALLGLIGVSAFVAIVFLAGPISSLVVEHRWIMYSIFIGLTLGGVPIVWKLARPLDATLVITTAIGIAVMAVMVFIGPASNGNGDDGPAYVLLFVAGLAAASAMVLPGISGSYLLLVLGQYVAIFSTVATLKGGVEARDAAVIRETMHVLVPVGVGTLVGIVGVSNLVKVLLAKCPRPTLGVLLGLLLGAVIGLYPFQHGVAPSVGDTFRGDVVVERDGILVMERSGRDIEPADWPTETFTPNAASIAGAASLIIAGFGASMLIGRIGGNSD